MSWSWGLDKKREGSNHVADELDDRSLSYQLAWGGTVQRRPFACRRTTIEEPSQSNENLRLARASPGRAWMSLLSRADGIWTLDKHFARFKRRAPHAPRITLRNISIIRLLVSGSFTATRMA